jgi:hypothetical protein
MLSAARWRLKATTTLSRAYGDGLGLYVVSLAGFWNRIIRIGLGDDIPGAEGCTERDSYLSGT